MTADRLWQGVSGRLKDTLNETTFQTWFGQAAAGGVGDGVFTVVVPERLHARVDRGAFPRLPALGRE